MELLDKSDFNKLLENAVASCEQNDLDKVFENWGINNEALIQTALEGVASMVSPLTMILLPEMCKDMTIAMILGFQLGYAAALEVETRRIKESTTSD